MNLNTNKIGRASHGASTLFATIVAFGTFGVIRVLTDLRAKREQSARREPLQDFCVCDDELQRQGRVMSAVPDQIAEGVKLVTLKGLADVLGRSCSSIVEPRPAANPASPSNLGRAAIFCSERLREVSGGDSRCERELLRTFLNDAVAARSELRAAFEESDSARVLAAAHGLAGACCTLGADSMAAFCRELELSVSGETIPRGQRALADFEREYESLRVTVVAYLEILGNASN